MKQELIVDLQSRFNAISHNTDDENIEFWYARDLQTILGYDKWKFFLKSFIKLKSLVKILKQRLLTIFLMSGKW